MENLNKLGLTLALSIVASTLITAILSLRFGCWCWTVFIIIIACPSILGSLYGEEPFNITGNWPVIAKKIKRVIGYILVTSIILGGIAFIAMIVIMTGQG